MELRTHVTILQQSKWFIIFGVIATAIAAFVFALYRPVSYQAVVSFDLNFVNRPDTIDYQYGGYYDLKAAEIYTQHIMSWFLTPAFVEEIYQQAGVGYEIDSIPRFTNRFKTEQYSAQNFIVEFRDYSREQAQKLADALTTVVERRASLVSEQQEQALFSIIAQEPVVAETDFNPWVVAFLGALAGLFATIVLVYLREYLRE